MTIFRSATVAAAAIAALAATGPAAADTPVLPEGTLLEVSAVGRVVRTPDLATVRAGVVTQAASAGEASRENATRMARVVAALRGAGIAARDMSTSAISLSPEYRYTDGQPPAITGYRATTMVTVRFRDVGKAGPILDALVREGANQIEGPTLSLAEPEGALDAARTDAVARARARADLYARAAGLRVERILSISETGENDGGRPEPAPYMMRVRADAAPTEVLPGETDVSVTVAVRFVLR